MRQWQPWCDDPCHSLVPSSNQMAHAVAAALLSFHQHLAAKRNGRTLPAFTLHHVHKPHHGSLRALWSPSLRRTTLSLWLTWAVFGMTYYGVWRARHMPPPSLIRVCSHSALP